MLNNKTGKVKKLGDSTGRHKKIDKSKGKQRKIKKVKPSNAEILDNNSADMQQSLAEEPAQTSPTFKRKKRYKEKVKVVENVKNEEIKKSNFFVEEVSEKIEHDYIHKEVLEHKGLLANYDEDENGDSEILVLSKKIADAFEIEKSIEAPEIENTFFVEPEPELELESESVKEPEPELEPESVKEPEPELVTEPIEDSKEEQKPLEEDIVLDKNNNVLQHLAKVTDDYLAEHNFANKKFCEVVYLDDSVRDVSVCKNKIQMSVFNVYVNGVQQDWDNLFEVKLSANSVVEIETGVSINVPDGVSVKLGAIDDIFEKYSLKCLDSDTILTPRQAAEPIIVRFLAEEGAYVSKIGKVVECQLI